MALSGPGPGPEVTGPELEAHLAQHWVAARRRCRCTQASGASTAAVCTTGTGIGRRWEAPRRTD